MVQFHEAPSWRSTVLHALQVFGLLAALFGACWLVALGMTPPR